MRGILFRGKRIDSGAWINGYYVKLYDCNHDEYIHCIYTGFAEVDCGEYFPDWFEIDPATLGANIGLTDKNGKDIFEGDIIELDDLFLGIIRFGKYEESGSEYKTHYGYYIDWCNMSLKHDFAFYTNPKNIRIKVIGNIHDNPELLEVDT